MRGKTLLVVLGLVVLMGVTVGYYLHYRNGRNTLPKRYYTDHSLFTSKPEKIDHVVIIMEENKSEASIIGNVNAPYINSLLKSYSFAKNYYAVTNPSLPNYLALTSGTTAGISNDCNPPGVTCQANVTNITDRLKLSGRTWKAYAESMPAPCFKSNSGLYVVKHNPFMYYPGVTANKAYCQAHILPFSQFALDLASGNSLPSYAFITPNLCSDMHDCSIQTGNNWLNKEVPALLNSPAFKTQNSLLVIVWDEGDIANNNVPVIFAGPAAKTGYISSNYYSHYSLLHTIEKLWGLPPLTANDRNAPLMYDLLK